jgi:hypothetical protein
MFKRWVTIAAGAALCASCGETSHFADNDAMGAAGETGSTANGTGVESLCEEPIPLVVDYDTGFMRCGVAYRAKVASCTDRSASGQPPPSADPRYEACSAARDCNAYGCLTDDDCSGDTICECSRSGLGRCVLASCKSDADCGAGLHCALLSSACRDDAYHCETPDDACLRDADCRSAEDCLLSLGVRECRPTECVDDEWE